jgi:transposase
VALLFFPPYAPELHPLERLWRDLNEWLAHPQPDSWDVLSTLLCTCLQQYAPAALRSLTSFPYLLAATQIVNGQSS